MKTRELWSSKATSFETQKDTKRIENRQSPFTKASPFEHVEVNFCFLRGPPESAFFCRRSKHRRSRFSALPYFGMISFRTEHMSGTNFFNIARKKLKIAQIAQVNQLFLPLELRFAYTGTLRQKGVPVFEASGIRKGRDFTNWSIWKGRRHFGLKYDLKGLQKDFRAVEKSRKCSGSVIDQGSYLRNFTYNAFTAV